MAGSTCCLRPAVDDMMEPCRLSGAAGMSSSTLLELDCYLLKLSLRLMPIWNALERPPLAGVDSLPSFVGIS